MLSRVKESSSGLKNAPAPHNKLRLQHVLEDLALVPFHWWNEQSVLPLLYNPYMHLSLGNVLICFMGPVLLLAFELWEGAGYTFMAVFLKPSIVPGTQGAHIEATYLLMGR